ncbi:MAG: hypothetical protein LBV21_06935, partial [Candidatus Adiutrix sp.]|nr:hypothetical protein [Candidatus Adiutrix sp.]
MDNLAADSEISPAAAPLRRMLESYSRCLDLGRDFLAETLAEGGEDDLDLDRLERFLNARADLFAVAETSFRSFDSWDGEDPSRRALTRKV